MRILHVDTERGWRGGEQQLFYLVKGLKERGFDQAVACRVGDELEKRCREIGVEVIPLKGNQTSDCLRLGAVGKRFDVIHAHSAKAHTVSALSKRFHRKPVVYTRRVDYSPKRNAVTRLKYRLTDRVVAISEAVKNVLERELPFLKGKVSVIPSAVDVDEIKRKVNPERVEEIKRELGGKPLIGTLAALTEQKDIPNFIEAAELVLRELPSAKFVVFGEGKLRKTLEEIVERKGLNGKFILYGFVRDVPNYTKALDLFVLPSRNEGLGSSLLIAMALKVPVIATEVGGTVEAVKHGDTGILVPPENPEALSEGILSLIKDESLKKKLTENAFQLVLKKFSVSTMVDSYVELYREVKGGRDV